MTVRPRVPPAWNDGSLPERPVYELEVRDVNGLVSRTAMPDPFHTTRIGITPGLRNRLRAVIHALTGRLEYTVSVNADRVVVEAVCELDPEYLGAHGSERRERWDAHLNQSLGDFAAQLGEHEDA